MENLIYLVILVSFIGIPITLIQIIINKIKRTNKSKKKQLLLLIAVFIISFILVPSGKADNSSTSQNLAVSNTDSVTTALQETSSSINNSKDEEDINKELSISKIKDDFNDTIIENTKNTFPEATIVRVVDGDTVEVSVEGNTYKLRMIGVNTPETKHPKKGVEFFGKEASAFTTEQLTGKTVYLQKDVSETDKYGRLLRYIWIQRPGTDEPTADEIKSLMFNSILVANGYANSSSYAPDIKYQDIFKELERPAREQGWGLWGYEEPIETPTQTSEKIVLNKDISQEYIADTTQGKIKGNKKSKIYHVPGGASYNKISVKNVVYFNSEEEAQAAGYRRAQR